MRRARFAGSEKVPNVRRRRAGYPPEEITFDYLDTVTAQVRRGQIAPTDRVHLRAWLARLVGRGPRPSPRTFGL